ncbi:MAG: DUF1579 domain-containing protein [Planctomycetota bacterium]|jgi:hypothetical protein
MKTRLLICGFVLGVATALLTGRAISQDQGAMPSPEDMQAMMEEYMATLEPGKYHKLMEGSVGTWDTTTKMWWGGPGSPPSVTEGTAERRMIMGGRFMMEEQSSVMMMPDPGTGQMQEIPWKGMGLFGYDNYRKMYNGVWLDSMSTFMLTMKGTVNPTGDVFTYYGEMDEPMLGVVGRMVKYVTRIIDEDTQVFEIIDLHAGDDYKVVEVTYNRRK